MNFLAHAVLAGDDPALIVGGVIGDWIKGPLPGLLPPDLARGVALHRAIDSHAETNPAFQRSRNRIGGERRRYAGILVDIFYDHLLARDWRQHQAGALGDFCAGVYRLIDARLAELPTNAHHAMRLMADENWLQSYVDLDGIADVLARMAQRARKPNPLAGGEQAFIIDAAGFAEDFACWQKDAQAFAARWADR